MAGDDLVTVYSGRDPAEAEIVRIALEAEGIACSIGNEHQAGLAGILEVPVLVKAVDAERARELIHAAESH